MDGMIAPLSCQRALFEVPREVAYFNNGSYTPLPRSVRAAGEAGVAAKSAPWTMGRDDAVMDRVRAAAAGFVGAEAADIAVVNAAAYGVATAAANLDVGAGTRILMIAGEFPSLALAWARLAEERGAVLDIVERPEGGDWTAALQSRIAQPGLPPVGVAALTPLVWTDGSVIDLEALVPALKAQGAAIVVDATQGAGVLPLDVARLGADYLVFPTYKWLLGPYSLAFMYVAPHRQADRPIEQHGGGYVGGAAPFGGRLGAMVPGAARFDMGQRGNPVALPMALAGMELLHGWGRAAMAARMRATTDALAAAAEAAGARVVPRRFRPPHILGVHVPDAAGMAARLEAAGVHAAERGGVLRLGAHVFNDEADVRRFGAALSSLLRT